MSVLASPVRCGARDGCPGTGTWTPVLLLRLRRRDAPLRARLPELASCEAHKEGVKLADYLSPEGWERLSRHLREAGRGSFSRDLTTLSWEHNGTPDVDGVRQGEELPF